MSTELMVLQKKMDIIKKYPIVKISDDKSSIVATNNFKTLSKEYKEAEDIAKSLKKPYQDEIKKINIMLDMMKTNIDDQNKEIGRWAMSQKPIIENNIGHEIEVMKTKSQVGGSVTSFLYPDVKVLDLLIYIDGCMTSGHADDLLETLQVNYARLNKICHVRKLKDFPGLKIDFITKTNNY
jgi:hypothetical protein